MSKRSFSSISAFFLFAFFLTAESPRIAVMDLTIQSANEDYQFLGKGFAEFIAVELATASGFTLVDRSRRNDIIEEQKFGLSGMADGESAVEIGRILTANYLVSGNIFDMMGRLVVTLDLVSVESGEIVTKIKAEGELSAYDGIVKNLARDITRTLKAGEPVPTEEKVPAAMAEKPKETAQEVILTFSEAIDAYDRNDDETAETKLQKAAELDPESEAVRFYLSKYMVNSSRFTIVPSLFFSRANPASLAFRDRLSLSFHISTAMTSVLFGSSGWYESYTNKYIPLESLYGANNDVRVGVDDNYYRFNTLLTLPLTENLGISAGLHGLHQQTVYIVEDEAGEFSVPIEVFAGVLNCGWSPTPTLSLGAGITLGRSGGELTYPYMNSHTEHEEVSQFLLAITGGVILQNRSRTFVYSLYGGFTNQVYYTRKEIESTALLTTVDRPGETGFPVFLDQTFTLGLRSSKTFLVQKTACDISLTDGIPQYFQPLVAVENWFNPSLALRAGTGYFFIASSDGIAGGLGLNGGGTFLPGDGLELDLSATYRQRPTSIGTNEIIPELAVNISVEWYEPFGLGKGLRR